VTGALVVAIIALVVALAALAWAAGLAGRVREMTSARGELARMAAEGDLPRLAAVIESRLDALEKSDDRLRMDDGAIADRLSRAVRHVGLVRFDALPGLAGMFSFSLALLNDHRDGVVITSIYGRTDSRMYVKPVTDATSDVQLTDEETDAIAQALGERRQRRG
jgi:hypothetical protein